MDYGCFHCGPRNVTATRGAYFFAHGKDPYPYFMLHSCDWPPCVNPLHLSLGDWDDNKKDELGRKRNARRERHGCAKLKWETVAYARAEQAKGRSYASIAKELNVSPMAIWYACNGKTWRPE